MQSVFKSEYMREEFCVIMFEIEGAGLFSRMMGLSVQSVSIWILTCIQVLCASYVKMHQCLFLLVPELFSNLTWWLVLVLLII